ncbi:MAG: MarR family transcriptional regulator [Candidatus Acidiferrales bacterium]
MRSATRRGVAFADLAELRYQIRRFLNFSEQAARAAGIEPQQHQALLAIKGLRGGEKPTVGFLSERLQILHHTAGELVNRLEAKGLIRRSRSRIDRREVLLRLTRGGEKLLQALAQSHQAELNSAGPSLLRALKATIHIEKKTAGARASGSMKLLSRSGYHGHVIAGRPNRRP